MRALVKNGELVEDPFLDVSAADAVPGEGALILSLAQWLQGREELAARADPLGVRLKSHESPELVASDLARFAVVALEFPKFRDGRAYTYARWLRDRFAYKGEVRAVGDVLLEQLHFMLRVGFDAFELDCEDPLATYLTALEDYSVWYQPTGDGRPTAMQLRRSRHGNPVDP
ncbi:MAG TPA: DUF934 domain-containing protein [Gammaproteobacteria bacterium]|nr:DUF934 domain-containing protein [Gammaproteobacteria bacterium]